MARQLSGLVLKPLAGFGRARLSAEATNRVRRLATRIEAGADRAATEYLRRGISIRCRAIKCIIAPGQGVRAAIALAGDLDPKEGIDDAREPRVHRRHVPSPGAAHVAPRAAPARVQLRGRDRKRGHRRRRACVRASSFTKYDGQA